jgi:ribosomal protein S18 acetylase RimI-like enzyme
MTNQDNKQTVRARPVTPEEAERCGVLLGLCFEEEAWSAALIEVLDDPASRRRFMRETSVNELEAYVARAKVYVVDAWELPPAAQSAQSKTHAPDTQSPAAQNTQSPAAWDTTRILDPAFDGLPAGVVLFDTANAFTPASHEALWQHSLNRGCAVLSAAEAQLLRQRVGLLESFDHNNWSAQAFPNGYGYLSAVCVNPRYRGHGILDALFAPAIAHAQAANIPLCLETYAERSRDIYLHKGFELVDTLTNSNSPLIQYCMVKRPQ